MKQLLISLLSGTLILTACAQKGTVTPLVVTPSSIPTSTSTSVPTEMPTASITPLPTIPTFTPTFDVSTIVTVTPAPPAECPEENPSLKPMFSLDKREPQTVERILNFLNDGGSIKMLVSLLPSSYYPGGVRSEDLTGDRIPELAYSHYSNDNNSGFYIFTCTKEKYTLYKIENPNWGFSFYGVYDMNLNGMPELVVISRGCSGTGCYRHYILEWNGSTYVNLAPDVTAEGVIYGNITDINNDDILELVLRTAPLPFYVYQPWRTELHVFSWNGNFFVAEPVKGYQPQYRFQAIQDADLETTLGSYDIARNLYKQAIFNSNLEWWSRERQAYENAVVEAPWIHEPTPSVKPLEDKTEYPRLAAYAYYHIMLLHFVQGNGLAAETTYTTLQGKFGNDPYAQPYIEMATAFWDAYQSRHKMYDGCAGAIEYAAERPEILIPLGSDYHGSQSHTYVPANICPFR